MRENFMIIDLKILMNKIGLIKRIGNYSWRNIERFNPSWKIRIKFMSNLIDGLDKSVVDMGCGPMWLKQMISKDIDYYGVDYKPRDESTIVCDFNKYEFPKIYSDVYFVSGCLEYVDDYEWFVEQLTINAKKCIISYCTVDSVSDAKIRNANAWVNNLSCNELIKLFNEKNMQNYLCEKIDNTNTVFVFGKVNA